MKSLRARAVTVYTVSRAQFRDLAVLVFLRDKRDAGDVLRQKQISVSSLISHEEDSNPIAFSSLATSLLGPAWPILVGTLVTRFGHSG